MKNDNVPKYDFDTHWKEVITYLFNDFLAFFMPGLYAVVDFEYKPEFLEQELHEILPKGFKEGKAFGDKVVKVKLKNGDNALILIHIEIQSNYDPAFLERMITYYYRVKDKEQLPLTAIAIYTDTYVPKNYNRYVENNFGTINTYEFNAYKVIDAVEEDLLVSQNPFALVVLASKYLNTCNKDEYKPLYFQGKIDYLG